MRRRNVTWQLSLAMACMICLSAGLSMQTAFAMDKVADWTLDTADGGTVNFHESLAKGPVVVSFWATWCRPCLKEMPHLNRMAAEYEGEVTFLAVNTDNSKSVAKVSSLLQAKGFDNLIVPMDTSGEIAQLLQVGGTVPFLIMYDGQGREIYRHVGYKEGDEEELNHEIIALLDQTAAGVVVDTGKPEWGEAVSATDKFKYSYNTDTKKEIFENWLDISYQFGGFRTGLMLNSQAPSEEGYRQNSIKHRFFEFNSGDVSVRAGHFYGLFGRGLVFNAFEDRVVRVDTRLDGMIATVRKGALTATAFSGSPSEKEIDVRGADIEYGLPYSLKVGFSGLTYRPDDFTNDLGEVNREWVASLRARQNFSFGDYYFEYGVKKGYEYNPLTPEADQGDALYTNINLYQGPVSVSWERSDYDKFTIIPRADGVTPLNRPPSLTREFAWTLTNRSPHATNSNDERGNNLDVLYSDEKGWTLLGSGVRIKDHAGETKFEMAFSSLQKENIGPLTLTGGFGYLDSEGLRQIIVSEVVWKVSDTMSWTLQAEHQHVRLGGGHGFNLGAYDENWIKLEFETAPRWAFSAVLETNNKYEEQRPADEKEGPFPAGQITYTINRGGNLNLWGGKRQAGYLCSGGVCKYEPAFTGVEVYGLFRY